MRILPLVAVGVLLSVSLAARGDELFTLTDNLGTTGTITFTLPDSAFPSSSDANKASYYGVPVSTNGVLQARDLFFYTTASGGPGLQLFAPTYMLILHGPQLFTGPVTNPVFAPGGPYSLLGNYYPVSSQFGFNASYTLNITQTVTPEPSSLALLGTGLLGAVGIVRRRFR